MVVPRDPVATGPTEARAPEPLSHGRRGVRSRSTGPQGANRLLGSTRLDPGRRATFARGRIASVDTAWWVVVGISSLFGLLALLLPHPYPSFDEAKYLAIGHSSLAGHGPLTAFGDRFLVHSPFWPMLFAAPDAALHLDPWAWGYLLNAISGVAVLLLAARVAWRFGSLAAVLATATLAAWVGLFGLARTARLDVPEAALTLAYLAVAMSAIETGLVRRGILAGVLFAWAYLTKEASLTLLAAPFIAAIALRRPPGQIALAAGLVILAALPMMSWWYAWFADQTGRVFALGISSSLLAPMAIALLALGLLLVTFGLGPGPMQGMRSALEARIGGRRTALGLSGLLTAVWIAAFLVAFSRADVQAGRPLFDVVQLERWVAAWASDLALLALVGLGLVPALGAVVRADDRPIEPIAAIVAAIPWLLLVAVLGEPPRDDIAVLALLAAVGAGGWLGFADRVHGRARLSRTVVVVLAAAGAVAFDSLLARAGVASGITHSALGIGAAGIAGGTLGAIAGSVAGRSRLPAWLSGWRAAARVAADGRVLSVAVVIVLAIGTLGAVSVHAVIGSQNVVRRDLATAVAAWLEANVPADATVMFGSVQANETALVLDGHDQLRHLQATLGVASASAPLGLEVAGGPAADVVVIDPHPRQNGFFVFTGSKIRASLEAAQPVAIVYVTGIDTATPSMIAWLAGAPGITLATTIESPEAGTPLVARIYRVDMSALEVPTDRTYASSAAILRLIADVGGSPQGPAIARSLLGRVVLTDTDPPGASAMADLRALAAR